jgi:ADP-ribose pyrophosphatase
MVHRGRVFDVTVKDVRWTGGTRSRLDIIEHPGAVAIYPLLPDGRVALIRQVRIAAGGALYELPAGTREPRESPSRTARRELIEEIGYRARRIRKIAEFYTAPGFCTEFLRVYLATELSRAEGTPDTDERIRVVPVPRPEAMRMTLDGRIRDAKSIIGIWAAERTS